MAHRLGFIIAAAVVTAYLVLTLLGIHIDPYVSSVRSSCCGRSAPARHRVPPSGGRCADPDAERRALAGLQQKYAGKLIEEHRAGTISADRRNE